jgi:xylan 1,4-beta-xylosidase
MGRYRNPVLPGCHPDPSICRVGDEYFLVTSTFEYFPGLPIHRSRDLVDWELVGHAVHRADQLDLSTVPSSGGLFAPTIRHHGGRFHVVCTLVHGEGRQGHFLVTATDPAGPWSAPVWFDGVPGIDPSLTFDEGRVWMCGTRLADPGEWEGQTDVWLHELDPITFAPIGAERLIWRGALVGARWAEGPHLYRRDGRWLLLAAEGGTERDHAVCVAYADEITGPYTGDPGNPRLTHRDLGSRAEVVNVGHADLVDAPDGRSWAVLLATRTVDGGGVLLGGLLGRETHLVPVDWEAGRPLFAPGVGRVEAMVDAEGVPDQSPRVALVRDDFDRPVLDLEWNTLRGDGGEHMSLTDRPGHLRLRLGATSPTEIGPLSFVGRRLPSVRARIAARVELESPTLGEEAGLLLRQSEDAHLALVVRSDHANGRVVEASLTTGGRRRTLGEASVTPDGPLELELTLDGFEAELSVRGPSGEPTRVALADTSPLASEVAGGFLGVWVGVVAVGAGVGHADFDWFELESRD